MFFKIEMENLAKPGAHILRLPLCTQFPNDNSSFPPPTPLHLRVSFTKLNESNTNYNVSNLETDLALPGVTNGLCEHSRACEHCDFFASTSRDKKFALRAASSLESTTREQRALLIFSACSNPYGNPFL